MAGLTEEQMEDVRRIVREELKSLLESLGTTANGLDVPYETRELESSALMAIEKVLKEEASNLPHDWECATRAHWDNACDCGIDGKEKNDD